MSMIEIALREINGKEIPAVTSLQVAEHFGKEHRNVLADVRNTIAKCSESFSALNFQLAEYTDEQAKPRPMYLLSKDGFMMVAMAYTTPEAMRIKEAYIARFNDMERELAGRNPSLPQTYADALRALAAEVEIRQAVEQQKALAESQRECLTRMPVFGILNVPNYHRRIRRLCRAPHGEKCGFSCFCHQSTSLGVGYILAKRRPGVREAPAAVVSRGASFCLFLCPTL